MKKILTIAFIASVVFGVSVFGQTTTDTATTDITLTVPSMAVLDVHVEAVVSITLVEPTTGGAEVATQNNTGTSYLQYTTVREATSNTFDINVQLDSSSETLAEKGLRLDVQTAAPGGTGATGTALVSTWQEVVEYGATVGNVITAIGSGWTGTGNGLGSELTYRLYIDNYAAVYAIDDTFTVLYTIVQQ